MAEQTDLVIGKSFLYPKNLYIYLLIFYNAYLCSILSQSFHSLFCILIKNKFIEVYTSY